MNVSTEHLTDIQVAAYLDRGLSRSDRDRVEGHLASCPECRAQLIDAQELVARSRRPRRALAVGSLAAVAATIVFFIVRPTPLGERTTAIRDAQRSGGTSSQLLAYGPLGETHAQAIRFVWGSSAGARAYRVTITQSDGAPVWSHSGEDTSVALPDSIAIRPGQRYVWVTDALLSDGSTRTTGLREFNTMP